MKKTGRRKENNLQDRPRLWLEWYDNGQMKKEVNYKDGEEQAEGSAKYWNRKGEPVDSEKRRSHE